MNTSNSFIFYFLIYQLAKRAKSPLVLDMRLIITLLLSTCAWLVAPPARAQAPVKFTLSGYIKDAANGEGLIGATVQVTALQTGVAANVYGFYSLSLPAGKHQVVVNSVGYTPQTFEIDLKANQKLDVQLAEAQTELEEVVVSSERPDDNVQKIEMSVNRLDVKTIKAVPAFLGEADVIKAIQLLPGISSVGEGSAGYNARGGGVDQNLVLQDEAPVYNTSHLFGFFSVFNPDMIKDVKLVKGGIPAQYGGRLSSSLDVRLKEGNNKKFETTGGIGTVFSRLTLEGPIAKDKASFIIGARRSYIDVLAQPFLGNTDFNGAKLYFYDLTAKVNWDVTPKDKVFLSGYLGQDVFGASNIFGNQYGNSTATLRWNHIFGDKLFGNFTAFYSNYNYSLNFNQENSNFDWKSNVVNYSFKPEFNWFLNDKNTITFGGQAIYHDFRPGDAVTTNGGVSTNVGLPHKYALETALFIGNEQTLTKRLSAHYGLRYSWWNYLGTGEARLYPDRPNYAPGQNPRALQPAQVVPYGSGEPIQTYGNFEPRLALKYELNPANSLKLSYNRMAQYLHLLSNTAAASPLDLWVPSTNNIKPQISDQIALGYFRNFKDNMFEASVEVYYKDLQNQIDYIPGANLLLNPNIEGELLYGKGRAYGAEFFLKKNTGKLTGWVSYTLSRTERLVNGINRNEWFAARFDRTHNLNVSLQYELNKRWSFSTNFVYQSGTPATFPTERVEFQGYTSLPFIGDYSRSNVRIPAYHRLDLSATLQGKKGRFLGRDFEKYWVFSVYNFYNRRNPYSTYFQADPDNAQNNQAVRFSVIGSFVPSASFNFKF
jgi:CarboxypepD_reg-like domain/TonB dependent receptor/TonB-dependent Receptor Plug Domain